MDIFTTALTRVVPVPIKPANLKVKALLKEARVSKLKADPDHLENHDCYFGPYSFKQHSFGENENENDNQNENNDQNKNNNINQQKETKQALENLETTVLKSTDNDANATEKKTTEKKAVETKGSVVTESEDGKKHLDLYI
ncbi:MAG: hypothetical protein JJV99_10775 [Colwellia sp.]|nr:hypothetical protein [Colwellia sp.]